MPLKLPPLDDRTYQDLVDQALARIPAHTPEWTNFGKGDPGVTLIEVFAFLGESILYRAKQIPDRNRKKLLTLLGVPLQPASSAVGLVAFDNQRGALETMYLAPGLEVRAGQVPFRTDRGLDVIPVEVQVFYKRNIPAPAQALGDRYGLLNASFRVDDPGAELGFYETTPFPAPSSGGLDLDDAIDGALWIALLLRENDPPGAVEALLDQMAGRTLDIGVVPAIAAGASRLAPGASAAQTSTWDFDIPTLPAGGLPAETRARDATYQTLAAAPAPSSPQIFEVTLPGKEGLRSWRDIDAQLRPLESGSRGFPPALDDKRQRARVITWIRIKPSPRSGGKILWIGANAALVTQRARVTREPLPEGNGEPDQSATLARTPVLPGAVRVTVGDEVWAPIDDLYQAGAEVPVPDPRLAPGAAPPDPAPAKVFQLDAEAGLIRFGDGLRGMRPPRGAAILVDYDHGAGRAGNVGPGSIKSGAALPAGVKVTNPVATWGGADAETVSDGERQVARWLQHRDRLVTAEDFEIVALRTPGVSVGRVDVLPAYHPDLSVDAPGDAPGVVTLMVIPASDPVSPDAPSADQPFLQAIADYLDPRRLITTELVLRGPTYKTIHVSIGLHLVSTGAGVADVLKAVEKALRRFLSPLPDPSAAPDPRAALLTPARARQQRGWPLRQAVYPQEIAAAANRVEGVSWVEQVRLSVDAAPAGATEDQPIPMTALDLPKLGRFAVSIGPARPIAELFGDKPAPAGKKLVPVPVIPEEC